MLEVCLRIGQCPVAQRRHAVRSFDRKEAQHRFHREALAAGARALHRHRHRPREEAGREGEVERLGDALLADGPRRRVGSREGLEDTRRRGDRPAGGPGLGAFPGALLGKELRDRGRACERCAEPRAESIRVGAVQVARVLERREVDEVCPVTDPRTRKPLLDRLAAPVRFDDHIDLGNAIEMRAVAPLVPGVRPGKAQRGNVVVPERVAVRFALHQHDALGRAEPIQPVELWPVGAAPGEALIVTGSLHEIAPNPDRHLGA